MEKIIQQIYINSINAPIAVQINFISENYGYIRLWLAGQKIESLDEPQPIGSFFLGFKYALQNQELYTYHLLSLGEAFDNYSFSYKKWDNDLEIVYRQQNTKNIGVCLIDFAVVERFISEYEPYFNVDFSPKATNEADYANKIKAQVLKCKKAISNNCVLAKKETKLELDFLQKIQAATNIEILESLAVEIDITIPQTELTRRLLNYIAEKKAYFDKITDHDK